jgi:hypothetical protein
MIDNQLQSDADREHPDAEQNALTVTMQDVPLINYDTARRALAEAVRVDEVRAIHDQAMALKACAKIVKDQQLELDAAEIRVRAERRLGEIMAVQGKTVGKAKGAKGIGTSAGYKKTRTADALATLAETGIDKNLAHRARNLAKLPQKEFDKRVAEMRKGERGGLDIRRAAKPVKHTEVRGGHADRHVDEVLDQVQSSAEVHRSPFIARCESADTVANYDGPLEPGWAEEFAILARNVAARWSALADRFEQAARDAEEQTIARHDEHERG